MWHANLETIFEFTEQKSTQIDVSYVIDKQKSLILFRRIIKGFLLDIILEIEQNKICN